jgi:6,7-dimethyl-8-ribityllumazine synthase
MLRAQRPTNKGNATGLRIGIAAAQYNTALADGLVDNCVAALRAAGVRERDITVLRVPGAFEVSVAAAKLARSRRCDCVIGLGVLVQGETSHAQHIAGAVAHGLTDIAIVTGIPTVFGIVTANNLKQAHVRCMGRQHNRGREAAETALAMARLGRAS